MCTALSPFYVTKLSLNEHNCLQHFETQFENCDGVVSKVYVMQNQLKYEYKVLHETLLYF